jgi:2-methylcitrate dehydratase PrpD
VSLTRRISEWAANLAFEDIPVRVIDRCKLQILSVLGAVFAGYGDDAGQRIYRVALRQGGEGSTLLPNGESITPAGALWAHAAFGVVHDFDDYLFAGHTGHSSVLASMAYAEREGRSGKDLLVAQTAVNELGGRLGASMLFGPQNGQMWSYIHNLGSAVSAGRLVGLDAEGIRRAIGVAFLQPPYALAPGFFQGESKILIAAEPAAAGARAAELAREGMTAPLDPLADDQGFLHRFAKHPLDWMFTGLGSAWVSDSLTYKVVPGCAYIDGAVDCLDEVRQAFREKNNRELAVEDVKKIRVWGSILTVGMEMLCSMYRTREELTTVGCNFSVPLSLAVSLIAGELVPEALSGWFLDRRRDEILALSDRISVDLDFALTARLGGLEQAGVDLASAIAGVEPQALGRLGEAMAAFSGGRDRLGDPSTRVVPDLKDASFEGFEMRIPARIALETQGGDEFSAEVEVPTGAAGRPFDETRRLVHGKFLRNAGRYLGDEQAHEALALIERIEEVDEVGELVKSVVRNKPNR